MGTHGQSENDGEVVPGKVSCHIKLYETVLVSAGARWTLAVIRHIYTVDDEMKI